MRAGDLNSRLVLHKRNSLSRLLNGPLNRLMRNIITAVRYFSGPKLFAVGILLSRELISEELR